MTTTIAFIGLGIMGKPMAINLVNVGFDVVGFNLAQPAIDALVEAGGRGASSIAEAVKDADVIAIMVPDSPDVEEVLSGADGVFANARENALIIDFSLDPAGRVGAAGDRRSSSEGSACWTPRCPAASRVRSTASSRSWWVAAQRTSPQPARSSRPSARRWPSSALRGSGQTVKAANQLIVAGTIELVAEAIVFLEAYGVDTEAAVKVLAGGLAGNAILQRKAAGMLARDFTPGFRIALHDKDMGIVTAAARQAGVVIPLGSVVAQLVASLKAQGDGGLDHTALLKLVEQLSGRNK